MKLKSVSPRHTKYGPIKVGPQIFRQPRQSLNNNQVTKKTSGNNVDSMRES